MFKATFNWRAVLAVITVAGGFAWAAPISAASTFIPSEYQQFTGQVGSFTDPCLGSILPCNREAPTATVDWGDNTPRSAGALSESSCTAFGCTWRVLGSHRYTEEGTYSVTVSWSDANVITEAGSVNSTAHVADAKPAVNIATPSCPENSSFSGTVATFIDPGAGPPSDWSATVHWWDGTVSQATITPRPSAPDDVSASHTCGDAGSHSFTVTVNDEGGASQTVTSTLDAYDPAPHAAPTSFSGVEGQRLGNVTLANFVDPASGPASDFSASIDWGDGSTSSGSVQSASGGGYVVVGDGHTYADEGSYQLTVTISDDDGSSAAVHPSATVSDAPLTSVGGSLSGVAGQALSDTIARFSDPGGGPASDFVATIHWGDGSTETGAVVADPLSGYDVNGSHTYAGPGTYAITVSVDDRGGSHTSADSTAHVNVVQTASTESGGPSLGSTGGSPGWSGSVSAAHHVACVVPKLRGKTLGQAKATLARARCRLGKVVRRHAKKSARGRVIGQGPAPGIRRAAGAQVALVVGR